MINNSNINSYCIIPCRKGSRRIPNKNKRFFAGKRMFEIAYKNALDSKLFDDVYISTNDHEIYNICIEKNIKTYSRSENNSTENATTLSAVLETINWFIQDKKLQIDSYDSIMICCLYPCTPFLKPIYLRDSYKLLLENKERFVYPVSRYNHPIDRSMIKSEGNIMYFKDPSNVNKRTQDLPSYYYDTGQFYWGFLNTWLNSKQMHNDAYGFDLTKEILYDIDNEEDFAKAEKIYKALFKIE